MPRLTCTCGHGWEEHAYTSNNGAATVCPACGSSVRHAESQADQAATVVQIGPWNYTSTADQPAPVLPDFEILEEIGRGGMGIVYRARQLCDNAIVAVKVIRKDRLQHEEAVRRFRREAQAAARLSHANIVKVHDFDRAGETHYLVMEFLDGITLERQVEVHGPLSIADACDTALQMALGLQHAHEQALVHRDIKPSNVMLGPPTGSGRSVKVLDMGVARVLQLSGQTPGDSLSTLTHGGSVIGTADYIAPEQLEDPHGADIRADLYSLGCTFYYMLTGQVPFPGGSLISKLDKQRWQDPTAIALLRNDIPPAVTRVVERLMTKRPADRYQTPGDLAHALSTLIQHEYKDPPRPRIDFTHLRRLIGHADAVTCVRYSHDHRHIASGCKDGALLLWDADTAQIVTRYPKHPQDIRSVAFSPAADLLASASGFTVRLFNLRGQEMRRFSGHTGSIRCLAFTHDGKRLATGSDDKTIRLWEIPSGREVLRLNRHTAGVTALVHVPGENRIVSASRDQTVRCWDLRSGLEVQGFDARAGNVLDVAISPDGTRLASAHFDTVVRIWNRETERELGQCVGHKQMVSALAFTPDGQHLLSAGQDHVLKLWDIENCTELASTERHDGGINALSISADGKRIVTGGGDKMLVLSDLPHP